MLLNTISSLTFGCLEGLLHILGLTKGSKGLWKKKKKSFYYSPCIFLTYCCYYWKNLEIIRWSIYQLISFVVRSKSSDKTLKYENLSLTHHIFFFWFHQEEQTKRFDFKSCGHERTNHLLTHTINWGKKWWTWFFCSHCINLYKKLIPMTIHFLISYFLSESFRLKFLFFNIFNILKFKFLKFFSLNSSYFGYFSKYKKYVWEINAFCISKGNNKQQEIE